MYWVWLRYAVVTGANKGIGLEICRQLAANGVRVVLTARDGKRGLEALESLKGSGLSNLVFHQLDVGDPSSISSIADFIKAQFGKLDILVRLKPSFLDDFFPFFFLWFNWFFLWQSQVLDTPGLMIYSIPNLPKIFLSISPFSENMFLNVSDNFNDYDDFLR